MRAFDERACGGRTRLALQMVAALGGLHQSGEAAGSKGGPAPDPGSDVDRRNVLRYRASAVTPAWGPSPLLALARPVMTRGGVR